MENINYQRFLSQEATISSSNQNESCQQRQQRQLQLQSHVSPLHSPTTGYYESTNMNSNYPLQGEQATPAGWLQPGFPTNCGSSTMDFPPFGVENATASTKHEEHNQYPPHSHNSQSPVTSVSPSSPDYTCFSKNPSVSSTLSGHSDSPDYTYSKQFAEKKNDTLGNGKVKRRSRMGCLTCRHRKKRCCETRPRCVECARLGLKCTWPTPGSEYRNKPKHVRISDGMHYDPVFGSIKILRGIVEYRAVNGTSDD
ncbi:Zn(II)2Cys6 transcription factor domain-containing protein CYBJADRAFT_168958 [Cyberlindnera jadinii NRRL Y-1542]|uniref:Zn(2)-C6 fungal-type domain-containing protein n=2 Tax=Cyberlindnera jadinii (strain ATCC 18201 / CBS 1600 / BCRC 20928 / JCM 3617 / NBRC 0987 / NRRL Y-1542) TaxID=983966 RepID=A0A1E4RXD5_CYBJN|nr:hypothetical protein CYBJADRAFT_168958 [Cyberlindnera jadinii NRRL Y-1542]ODV71924.1 hypothetical protein CYBJADRAFT_168958 [Cyberlindnera jadinii NRRL Y-1542]